MRPDDLTLIKERLGAGMAYLQLRPRPRSTRRRRDSSEYQQTI